MRFAVNTIASYLLTQQLLPLLGSSGRVINLSSAAQSPVDPEALAGRVSIDGVVYQFDSELGGETVVLWWGLFDQELLQVVVRDSQDDK